MSIHDLQRRLNELGYGLTVDGKYGPRSHAAVIDALSKVDAPAPGQPPTAPSPPATGAPLIPDSWMPAAKMARIHVHWTAGAHKANATDRKAYHILIEGDGTPVRGTPSIKLNEAPAKAGSAAHTLNANSGAIGISMCCMAGAVERPFKAGNWPMTKVQWDAMVRAVAQLAARYGIAVTPKTVLTHAEVQPNLGIAQRGKWDIAMLAFDTAFDTPKKVGDRLRSEVQAAR